MYKVTSIKAWGWISVNIEKKLEEHINEMAKQDFKLVSASWVQGGKVICVWEKKG